MAYKALLLALVACRAGGYGQGATCAVDEQCAPGLVCLRALCLRASETQLVFSPSGATVPPGAVVHMEAKVVHPRVLNGDVQLSVEGPALLSPTAITVADQTVLVRAPELHRQALFDVVAFSLSPEDGGGPPAITWNDGSYTVEQCALRRGDVVVVADPCVLSVAAAPDRLFVRDAQRIRYLDLAGNIGQLAEVGTAAIGYAGGRLFVDTGLDWLVLDAQTGAQLWSRPSPFVVSATAPADDSSIWASAPDAVHRVYLDGLGSIRFLAEGVTPGVALASRADGSLLVYAPGGLTLLRFAPSDK